MAVFSFITHECPQQALRDFVKEARRIVKTGGVVCCVDLDPRCGCVDFLWLVLRCGCVDCR
jgi:ubiquinone/menaquinone biosynthesis C-methylase UbiE